MTAPPRSPASLRAEWMAARRRRQRRHNLGLPLTDLTDAQPTRDHIQRLNAAGMSWKRIADASGVHGRTIDHIIWGTNGSPPAVRVRPETAAALLAVRPESTPTGIARRLQALTAIGWTSEALADAIGWDYRNFHRLIAGTQRVLPDTAAKVAALYDELWDRLPPQNTPDQRRAATRSRNRAARRGWPPPLAWDDDTIDDPDTKPNLGHSRPGAAAERAVLVAELTAAGWSTQAIALEIGQSERSVHRLRGRAS